MVFLVHVRAQIHTVVDDIMLYEVGYYFSIYYLLVHSSIFIHRMHDSTTRRAHHEPNEECDEIIKRIIMRHRVGNTDANADEISLLHVLLRV